MISGGLRRCTITQSSSDHLSRYQLSQERYYASKRKSKVSQTPRVPADQLDPERVPVINTSGKKSAKEKHPTEDRLRPREGGQGDKARYDADKIQQSLERAVTRFEKDVTDAMGHGGVGRPSTGFLDAIPVDLRQASAGGKGKAGSGRGVPLKDLAHVTVNTRSGQQSLQVLVHDPEVRNLKCLAKGVP